MTMHRRPLGRGRSLAAFAGVLLVVGCVLPWWKIGGAETGITPETGNGFEGAGILVFLVGIATLALVALPYAAGDRPVGIDRWLSYLLLTVIGWVGLGLSVVRLFARSGRSTSRSRPRSSRTARDCGSWRSASAILSRATYDMAREPAYR